MPRLSVRLKPRLSVKLGDYIVDCAWSPDGLSVAAALGDGTIELIDAGNPGATAPSRRLGAHGLGALALDWFGDGTVLCSSGQDGSLRFWPIAVPAAQAAALKSRQWTTRIVSRPNHQEIATAAGRIVTRWSADGTRLQDLPEQTSVVHGIAWSDDGKMLAAACTGQVSLWRFDHAAIQATRLAWPGVSLAVLFSPNGRYVAAGLQDGAVRFRRLAAQETAELSGFPTKVELLGWTANSRFLITVSGDELICWDFGGKGPQGREPSRLRAHTESIVALASHPTSGLVASAGRDWRIVLYEPGGSQNPVDVSLASAEPTVLRWSRDGHKLAVGHANGQLSIYELIAG